MADCRHPPSCNVAKTRSSKCTTTTTTTDVRGMDSITTWPCSCSRRRRRRCSSCCCSRSTLKRRSFRPCNRRGRKVYTDCCHNRLQLFFDAKQSKLSGFVMPKETTTTTTSRVLIAVSVLGLFSQVFLQLGNNQKGGFVALYHPNTSAKPKKTLILHRRMQFAIPDSKCRDPLRCRIPTKWDPQKLQITKKPRPESYAS
jgi:hypothetical protein